MSEQEVKTDDEKTNQTGDGDVKKLILCPACGTQCDGAEGEETTCPDCGANLTPTGSTDKDKDNKPTTDDKDKDKNKNKKPTTPAKRLDEMTILDLKKMGVDKLRGCCKKEKVSAKGDKDDLIERLRPKVRRITKQYIEGVTVCGYCGADIGVRGTSKEPLANGRVRVTRQIKCRGKHGHKYPLTEIARADDAKNE